MVPKASSPASAAAFAPSTLSRIHRILVPEKYGSRTRPVFSRNMASSPCSLRSAQMLAVRRHCQTMELWTGRPSRRRQTVVVSRWLVMPMPAMELASTPAWFRAVAMVAWVVCQMSSGSCSTQPGRG